VPAPSQKKKEEGRSPRVGLITEFRTNAAGGKKGTVQLERTVRLRRLTICTFKSFRGGSGGGRLKSFKLGNTMPISQMGGNRGEAPIMVIAIVKSAVHDRAR